MSRPLLLDLFCCQGGAAKGYHDAGFDVVGVDVEPQPRYPYEFVQMDALEALRGPQGTGGGDVGLDEFSAYLEEFAAVDLSRFAAVHASPPCQAFTKARKLQGNEHPDLLDATRELLEATGLPYVIENVKGAPLVDPVVLEGQMFPGLNVHRPRLFETNWPLTVPTLIPPPPRQTKMGRPPVDGEAMQVVGHFSDVPAAREAMGIGWMNQYGLAQAIPPAYTEFIGSQLLQRLQAERVAA